MTADLFIYYFYYREYLDRQHQINDHVGRLGSDFKSTGYTEKLAQLKDERDNMKALMEFYAPSDMTKNDDMETMKDKYTGYDLEATLNFQRSEAKPDDNVITRGLIGLKMMITSAGGALHAAEWATDVITYALEKPFPDIAFLKKAFIVIQMLEVNLPNSKLYEGETFHETPSGLLYAWFQRWFYGAEGLLSIADSARFVYGESNPSTLNKISYRVRTGEIRRVRRDPRSITHRPDHKRTGNKTSREWLLLRFDVSRKFETH